MLSLLLGKTYEYYDRYFASTKPTLLVDNLRGRSPLGNNLKIIVMFSNTKITALPMDKFNPNRPDIALLNRPIRRLDLTSKNTRAF